MSLIFLGTVGYIMAKLYDNKHDTPFIDKLVKRSYKYSGIDKESFSFFLENLNLSKENLEDPRVASQYLYKSLDHLEDIGLYNEYDVFEEIRDLAMEIAYEMEEQILESAIANKKPFNPRYLNNRIY